MKQKRWKYIQLNNSGSALISVVAVAIFLSVIATTIIYISGKNYQIKANDYQNKNTFYQAEMALDELKGALAADVSEAFKYAYREVMPEYVTKESGDKRNQDFHTIYFDCLYYMWTGATKYGTDIGKDEITTHVTVPGESVYTTVENFAADLPNFQQYFIPEDKLRKRMKRCVSHWTQRRREDLLSRMFVCGVRRTDIRLTFVQISRSTRRHIIWDVPMQAVRRRAQNPEMGLCQRISRRRSSIWEIIYCI